MRPAQLLAQLWNLAAFLAGTTAAPAISGGCAFSPEVVHIDADASVGAGRACLHVCPGYQAPLPPSGIAHIDEDADMEGEQCEQIDDFDEKIVSTAESSVAAEQECEDAFPYPSGLSLQGNGPYYSCADLANDCDWPYCPGIRDRIQNVWCRHTCGTCAGGGAGNGMAANPVVPTPGESSDARIGSDRWFLRSGLLRGRHEPEVYSPEGRQPSRSNLAAISHWSVGLVPRQLSVCSRKANPGSPRNHSIRTPDIEVACRYIGVR